MMPSLSCLSCGRPISPAEAGAAARFAFWRRPDGACPACLQQVLLESLLSAGGEVFHESVQRAWPLDAEAAFGALPTPLRMRADPRFTGRGITIAIADAGFTAHPDLTEPVNRIAAWVDATDASTPCRAFGPDEKPRWPGSDGTDDWLWHGTMTSVVCAGNGFAGHGLYRGLASDARVVLIQVRGADGRIRDASVERALRWVEAQASRFGIGVMSLSVSGDEPAGATLGPLDAAVERLARRGVTVVAAAGNDGVRRLLPPATAPSAITVGGLDDANVLEPDAARLWHGNYGESVAGLPKPELVAPSLWVAAPVLPGSPVAREARALFARRAAGDRDADARIAELKLISPDYQHVDGTSFAAPIVASTVACMLEANPRLSPRLVRELLIGAAHAVPGAPPERQGAGALDAGRAVARAVEERHGWTGPSPLTPIPTGDGPVFQIHDHRAHHVSVLGSWDQWREPVPARAIEPGLWRTEPVALPPGAYQYKIQTDGARWMIDPTNPRRAGDGVGGLNSVFRWSPG